MNLEIRNVKSEDIEPITRIIADTWNAKQFINNEDVTHAAITMMFIHPVLNSSTFGKVAVLDGELVGVIFGSRKGEDPTYRLLQENDTEELLQLLSLEDVDRKVFIDLVSATNEAYGKLIKGRNDNFQGCLEFFAISEKARGQKIGKKLWTELLQYFQNLNTEKIYVYTDTMSNYGFYEHQGFVRLAEEKSTFNLPSGLYENLNFIYEYSL